MEIWLQNSKYNIRFPVIPSEYSISSTSNNVSVNITHLSEVTLLGNRNLESVTFETFFPKEYDPFYCDSIPEYSPAEYREKFEEMKRDGVCKLTLTGEADWSKKVTIEQLDSKENDGSGDITISFTFKEYVKPIITVQDNVTKKTETTPSRPEKKANKDTSYTIKSGDCLSRIAQQLTGKASNWKTIYEDNKDILGSNPNLIYPGQQIKIRASY